jgi:outer membrane protein assembly factor BamB
VVSARDMSSPIVNVFYVLLVAHGLSVPLGFAQTNDWPQWRGPDHDGISSERNWFKPWPADGPTRLWKANVGLGFSSVSVSTGRVFTMGNTTTNVDTVFCLDAASGRVLWTNSYPCALDPRYYEGGPGATPSVDTDRVFTFSKKGHVLCIDAASGKTIWSRNIADELSLKLPEWSFAGSALVEGDVVILNAGRGGTALDKKTGRIVWNSSPEPGGYATPVPFEMNGQRALAIFSAKALVAVNPRTGQKLWEFPWETGRDVNAADPIVRGDKIFISSATGSALLQVRSNQVTAVWNKPNFMRNYFNPSVLLGDSLYGIDGTTHRPTALACVDFNTGEKKWSQPNFGSGALMAADNKLIILDKGELIIAAATPSKYTERSRAQVVGGKCWTVPVLANGRIYCRNAAGDLVCVQAAE